VNAEVDSNESNDDVEKLDEADFEQIAARDLITRFNQLGEEIQEAIPLTLLLTHVLEMLSNAFVRARAAAPGSVHVVPLSSAGYTGRCNLFVVGMDELTMGKTSGENPLLTDAQRQNLQSKGRRDLTLSSDVSHRQSWHFDRAVSKIPGKVTLLYSRYDVAEDRELYPSSVFLHIQSHAATELNDDVPTTYVSSTDAESETFPLDLTDVFIRAREAPEVQSRLGAQYPWIERGRVALQNRASAQWTHFDGQLGIETGALNPFRGKSRLSASRLETLVNCPFKYFLKYILKVRAPEEAEEDVWLDALERGSLIHRALARYMSERGEKPISEDDITALENVLFTELEEYAASRTAPNPAVEGAIRAEFSAVARAFIADEKERQSIAEPLAFEFGFGLWPHMKKEASDRTEAVTIDLAGLSVPLLGWVDRIDKARGGGIFITDYKTGSSNGYAPTDLLNRGRSLQWALYAYVVEKLLGEPVLRSGYLFPGSREMGRRIEADPAAVRDEVADHLRRMGRMAQSGAFVQAADETGACRYCDYQRVCGDIASVKGNVRSKMRETTPATPQYEHLSGWHYAEKRLGSEMGSAMSSDS
jgi:RecB family exonuclease